MEYKHLNGNGLKIGAAIEGEGPLIVLVHGWLKVGIAGDIKYLF